MAGLRKEAADADGCTETATADSSHDVYRGDDPERIPVERVVAVVGTRRLSGVEFAIRPIDPHVTLNQRQHAQFKQLLPQEVGKKDAPLFIIIIIIIFLNSYEITETDCNMESFKAMRGGKSTVIKQRMAEQRKFLT